MMASARRSFRLNDQAVRRMLHGRGGTVNNTLGGFASIATRSVREVARERITSRTGQYIEGIQSRVDPADVLTITASAPHSSYIESGTRPHVIRGNPVLVFDWKGQTRFFTFVNHPGTRPYNVLRDGVRRAGRQLNRLAR